MAKSIYCCNLRNIFSFCIIFNYVVCNWMKKLSYVDIFIHKLSFFYFYGSYLLYRLISME